MLSRNASVVLLVGVVSAPLLAGCSGGAPPPAAPSQAEAKAAVAESKPDAKDGLPAPSPAAAPALPDAAKPPPPPAPGKASSDTPILSKITQDDILAAVNKNGVAFNRCYQLGAGAGKTYRAKVTVKATVGPTGVVNTVEVVASTAKNAKVDTCVADAFKTLTFNRAAGSGATVFTFPLTFDGDQAP